MINKFRDNGSLSSSLKKIINDDDIKKCFETHYIPDVTTMSDGRTFLCTHGLVTKPNTSESYIVKFLIMNKGGNILNESKYDYAEMPNDGYLIRLILMRPYEAMHINLSYIVDISDIKMVQDFNNDRTNKNVINYNLLFESAVVSNGMLNILGDTENIYREYFEDIL